MNKRRQFTRKPQKQTHAIEEEVFVGLQRTASRLLERSEEILKSVGLSHAQYNVLRILRGAGPGGLPCQAIAARMITRDPDITRLLDRLESRHWVKRAREEKDRRVITARITVAGIRLLKQLDSPITEWHRRELGPVGEKKLRALKALLDQVRKEI